MSHNHNESTALVPAFTGSLASVHEALAINIGSGGLSEFDLPRLKIPAGGGEAWEIPGLEAPTYERVIEGVIVLARDGRAYFPETGATSQPPACSSPDAAVGFGTPGGECMKCPLSRFGSDQKTGRGQACKQVKQLFIIRGKALLPELIALPPTSLKGAKQYLLKLASQGIPYYTVVTRFTLQKTETGGNTYSRAVLSFARQLNADEAKGAAAYREMISPLVEKVSPVVDASEVQTPEEGPRPF